LFGRDAAAEKTRPTRPLVHHQGNVQSEVVGIEGSGVSARPSTQYDNVVHAGIPFSTLLTETSGIAVPQDSTLPDVSADAYNVDLAGADGKAVI
jgi:hypothetical protein